jgi:hypothetical protein
MKNALIALIVCAAPGYSQTNAAAPLVARRAFVNKYCAGCHNDSVMAGGMTLTKLDLAHTWQNTELAEKTIRKVRAGMMPPAGLPRPSAAEMKSFAASLENSIDAWASAHPNPGRPALHRLNRTEYANSIHDLLALDIDPAALLPVDDMTHGFDNMSDVLTVTPSLMDGYIRAAGKISRQAIGDGHAGPVMVTYRIPRVISGRAAASRWFTISPPMESTPSR